MIQNSELAHVDYLDGWRGLAILCVLIGHFFPVPGIDLGHVGVNLFFVLSGLLMTRLLFERDTPLPHFYKRRISRVFPALYAFVLVVLVGVWNSGRSFDPREATAALLFFRNYYPADGSIGTLPLGHLWSLCVEEHSYLLLGCMAFVARRFAWPCQPLLWLVTVVSAGFAVFYGVWGLSARQEAYFLRSEVNAFGIFISGALLLTLGRFKPPKFLSTLAPVLLVVSVLSYWWSVPRYVQMIVGTGLFAVALNLSPQAPTWFLKALSCKPLRYFGLWSFSIYLWQQPFYLSSLHPLLGLLGAVIVGLGSFYFLEQPIRVWLNRTWAR
ncbi:MAG TPA: acyltransferase [Rhodocyclaceae bacterium]|nr:acyltransferase [Rhodocyclaceae bacterium]